MSHNDARTIEAMRDVRDRSLPVDATFHLATTCGPVAWGRGRWPNVDWRQGSLIWVGWESVHVAWRIVRQHDGPGTPLLVAGTADPEGDAEWAASVLGLGARLPGVIDPTIDSIRARHSGMRPWANGSLFEGLIGAIVGQSISVAAAAITEARLAALFHDGVELAGRIFWPLPRAGDLAAAEPARVRQSGVTWRRAEALVAGGRAFLDGRLPTDDEARANPELTRTALRALPLVGPWTAESVLLWGLGASDAYPPRDVALLRAARLAYAQPDLDHPGLNALAETWSPHRAWAARWLWVDLLGPAPEAISEL